MDYDANIVIAGHMYWLYNLVVRNWAYVHHELRRPGVTLMLLWEEYRQREPDGYRYSRWCELYRAWESRLSPTMRQAHPAGERMFVDYAGQTIDLTDGRTGGIGSARMSGHWPSWAVCRRSWCPTTPRSGLIAPTGTSLASTAPISIWRPITVLPSCRRAPASRATKPRLRSPCWWSSVGSWRGCGTAVSSRWPS